MTNTINTEITFELLGTIYTRKANGYCYAQSGDNTRRIGSVEFETKYAAYEEVQAHFAEIDEMEEMKAEDAIREYEESHEADEEELVNYKGQMIRKGDGKFWGDPMNSCFYTKVDEIKGYEIIRTIHENVLLAVPCYGAEDKPEAKKKAPKAKKNAAYTGHGVTLTEKQVDFMYHLPDTCFWERGLDSCVWVDVLCDEIGGQFESKPMTVGAMISTICEKGLGIRGSDRRDGRKCTSFSLTELGKLVAKDLGLK